MLRTISFTVLLSSAIGLAQSTQASAPGVAGATVPSLDVISVKPNKSGSGGSSWGATADGMMGKNVAVHLMLTQAFHLNDDQLVGEPDWAKTEHFDVTGKVAPEDAGVAAKLTQDEKRVFFQQVLKERFGLVIHHETRDLPEYALTLAKGGTKLVDGQPDTSVPPGQRMRNGVSINSNGGVRRIQVGGQPIASLLVFLPNEVGRTIVDKTGLKGKYSFTLSWTSQMAPRPAGEASSPTDVGVDLFTAIQEQLGLKLEPTKGPVDVVVVDHVERPSEN